MEQNQELATKDLALIIEALGPDREQIILAGAFAVLCYRSIPSTRKIESDPLFTTDIDLVVPRPFRSRSTSLSKSIKDHGFVILPKSYNTPPKHFVQHERYGATDIAPVYVEFLTQRKGPEGNCSLTFDPGLNAQALPYLHLLLEDNMTIQGALDDLPTWSSPRPRRMANRDTLTLVLGSATWHSSWLWLLVDLAGAGRASGT